VGAELGLFVVVDGTRHPLALARDSTTAEADSLHAPLRIEHGSDVPELDVSVRVDRRLDALTFSLDGPRASVEGHTISLATELGSEGQVVFVSGVGQLADRATVSGHALLIDSDPHPLSLLSAVGPLAIDATPVDDVASVQSMRLTVSSPAVAPGEHASELSIVLGPSSMTLWRALAEIANVPVAPLHGHVTGTTVRSLIIGRDSQGNPEVRARVGADGAFAMDVPTSVVQWYAAIDPGRASGLVNFVPGTARDLLLDVSPGGDLRVRILDADSRAPLTARLLVRGLDGTVDPSFGPDFRASGAGPVIDALRGDVKTPLPSGRYRVAATKGIEWSVDAKVADIVAGRVTEVELAPRHVVPTPGALGCDLHVHARPSFDTPVTPEDRVLSLVAAGIDFAVPTEHNVVGDYSSALEVLDLGHELLTVPGIEVTTAARGFGHFGFFPFPRGAPPPPYRHTSIGAIFRAVREADPGGYFQLNHPRLPKGIGYFNVIGFDPKAPRSHISRRIDFDGIEVYNGYDSELPERVERVLRDYWALLNFGWRYTATGSSDSHRIQFHWAGYPRTLVTVDPNATVETDAETVDPLVIVSNVKKGHTVVTSGPIVEFQLAGARPGDEATTTLDPLPAHLRVRAAPWVDVTRIDVVAGQLGGSTRIVQSFAVADRPTQIGPEPGRLEEAQDRTVRFDSDFELTMGPDNGWVQVIVRGDRRMDDVLPFMPVPPLAFTNPVYVVRRPVAPPPFPAVPVVKPP
jgi:hypothetical protein